MPNVSTRRRSSGDSGDPGGGEQRSGPIAGTALIPGVTFAQKALQYADVDGLAIFEGDIVLGSSDQLRSADAGSQQVLASVGITGQQFRWPNGQVPYDIDAGMANQQRITDAIAHWEQNTPIRFVVRDASNATQFPDWAHFQDGGGCSSMVGKRGGRQNITLGSGCTAGNAIHEIGHTVGLWHEQSREDRDTFVRIEWPNIDPTLSHNFDQHIADGDDLGAYDYGSIMHYPATAFSVNGQPTIVALQPIPAGVSMGQRNGLSAGDIAGVLAMYPQLPTLKEVPKDPVFDPTAKEPIKDPIFDPTPKEVGKDPVTDPTRKEPLKDPIFDPTPKEVGKDPITDPTPKEVGKDPLVDPTPKEVGKDPITDPTFKEVGKDPVTDPTFKEVGKDPVTDPTFKEVGKDPVRDPVTIKEVGRDPIGPGATFVEVTPQPGFGQRPFVIAGGSPFQDPMTQAYNDALAQLQQLALALAQAEQQYQQLADAYQAALAAIQAFGQGQ